MKAIPILIISNIKLSYRIKIQFFFNFIFPSLLAFAYFQVFGRGDPVKVQGMMGPLVSLTMMTNAILVAGMRSAEMRDRDLFRQYHLTPVRARDLVVADLILGYLNFLPILLAELAIARYIYHAPVQGSYIILLITCTLGYFPLAALGLLLSSIFNTAQEAAVMTQLLFIILMFLSGTTMPLNALPLLLQRVAMFMPPAIIIVVLEGVIVRGYSLSQVSPELAALLLSGVTSAIVTALIFRWDKDEKVSRKNRAQAFLAIVPILIIGVLLNLSSYVEHWSPKIKTGISFTTQ